MKKYDTLILSKNELKFKRTEWIVSIFLQSIVFICTLFVFSLLINVEDLGSSYMSKTNPNGFAFTLNGYTRLDKSELVQMGFTNLEFDDNCTTGVLKNIKGIWLKKITATIDGKDIWNEDVDEYLSVIGMILLVILIFFILLLAVTVNNLSYSFYLKINQRKKYIQMLWLIGGKMVDIRRIFCWYFLLRTLIAVVIAYFVNTLLVNKLVNYFSSIFGDAEVNNILSFWKILLVFIVYYLILHLSFRSIWRKQYEDK